MRQNTTNPTETQDAMLDIAKNGQEGSDYEVRYDPTTGQLRFAQRGNVSAPPQPGSVPVTSIAASGFAGETRQAAA